MPGHVHETTSDGVSWWRTGKGRLVLLTGTLLAAAWALKFAVNEQVATWGFVAACLIAWPLLRGAPSRRLAPAFPSLSRCS